LGEKIRENWEENWSLVGAVRKSGISRTDASPGGAGLTARRQCREREPRGCEVC